MLTSSNETAGISPFAALSPLRLSAVHVDIISAGLNWLVWHHETWLKEHVLPHGQPALRWNAALRSRGSYDRVHMGVILRMHAAVQKLAGHGGRLRQLDSFDCAALALAVRTARQAQCHGFFRPAIPRFQQSVRRLLKLLEKHRKRAKRALQREVESPVYVQRAANWRRFVCWVRLHFLQFKPKTRGLFRYRRDLINNLVAVTRVELIERGARVPEEGELKRLVRLAVRYVRRGRRKYITIDLHHNHQLAAERLATFVTIHLGKHGL